MKISFFVLKACPVWKCGNTPDNLDHNVAGWDWGTITASSWDKLLILLSDNTFVNTLVIGSSSFGQFDIPPPPPVKFLMLGVAN